MICFFVPDFMIHFNVESISKMERFYRANFINALTGFKSPVLIGTSNVKGVHNLAIFNNLVHLGADPALIGFVNRPRESAPHTLANIEATGFYTINHISQTFIEQAHQTSAKYAEGISEFEKTGLTVQQIANGKAPFVEESPLKFALALREIIPIKFNNTYFVVGAITDIYLDDITIEDDGCMNLQQADIIASLGINGYYGTQKIIKLPYAKP
jgi:flavin reductase (DIM6/NTAB) family NADH-FMN oxidoreductase RutF